uniref:Uncharacterized protein n=1 Tax=Xanthomonas citri pv. phaseoli var. fuscans TaxID=473423 RepID=A0A808FHZ4_XANCI
MQRKPEQSICTVSPLLQTTLKRMALVACTVPHGRPWLMPWARLAADSVHGLACRPSVAYCSRRRCRNACLPGGCRFARQWQGERRRVRGATGTGIACSDALRVLPPATAGPGLPDGGRSSASARTPTGSAGVGIASALR